MVHALRRIHGSLRSEGLLLDLHPEPENAGVEVWRGGQVEHLGHVPQEDVIRDIHAARARLESVERDGWYVTESRRFFDLLSHSSSAEEWLQSQAQEGHFPEIPKEILDLVHGSLSRGDGEFVVREPIRASLLRPLPMPAREDAFEGVRQSID